VLRFHLRRRRRRGGLLQRNGLHGRQFRVVLFGLVHEHGLILLQAQVGLAVERLGDGGNFVEPRDDLQGSGLEDLLAHAAGTVLGQQLVEMLPVTFRGHGGAESDPIQGRGLGGHVPGKIRAPFPVVLHLFVLGQGRGHAGPHQQSGAGTGQGAASAADGAADGRAGQGADDGPGRHVLDKLLFFLTQFGNRCVTFRVILDHRCLRSVLAGATREQKSGHDKGNDAKTADLSPP